MPWRRGAVDIASASGTEDLGSNPARVQGFRGKNCVCLLTLKIKAWTTKNIFKTNVCSMYVGTCDRQMR
jgi:hypothetical protein